VTSAMNCALSSPSSGYVKKKSSAMIRSNVAASARTIAFTQSSLSCRTCRSISKVECVEGSVEASMPDHQKQQASTPKRGESQSLGQHSAVLIRFQNVRDLYTLRSRNESLFADVRPMSVRTKTIWNTTAMKDRSFCRSTLIGMFIAKDSRREVNRTNEN